jgi:hypothetical protein
MAVDRKGLSTWLARMRDVLNREWDPIRVLPSDDGGNIDEYDTYRDKLASMIGAHATDEELVAYLQRAETEWMGLGAPTDVKAHEGALRKVVAAIRALGSPPTVP